MSPLAGPLQMSAASMRMAMYLFENNLRMAQIFGQAALNTNPFFGKLSVQTSHSSIAPQPCTKAKPKQKVARANGKAKAVAKTAVPAAKPAAPKAAPLKAVAPAPAKPAKATAAKAKPATTKPAKAVIPKNSAAADAPIKRKRQPSVPPAMPDSRA